MRATTIMEYSHIRSSEDGHRQAYRFGQKAKSQKDKFIDTMPTVIQTRLITKKDWPATTKKAKELEHLEHIGNATHRQLHCLHWLKALQSPAYTHI